MLPVAKSRSGDSSEVAAIGYCDLRLSKNNGISSDAEIGLSAAVCGYVKQRRWVS